MPSPVEVTIIIPVKDEVESAPILAAEVEAAMAAAPWAWECLWVDDGSTDGTLAVLEGLHRTAPSRHQYLSFDRNYGKAAALAAAFPAARGGMLATLDGDLQNDPKDLPRMLAMLERGTVDLVNGARLRRHDSWVRRMSSRIANGFRNRITGVHLQDAGTGVRVFYRECIEGVPVFQGLHRFIPTLAVLNGFKMAEVPVSHRPRQYGKAKYGIGNRLWVGIADCFGVRWLRARRTPRARIAHSTLDTSTETKETAWTRPR